MNIILLGHADLASLYALNSLVAQCPEHRYTAFTSGTLASKDPMPGALVELAKLDADMCSEFRDGDCFSDVLASAQSLSEPNSAAGLKTLSECDPDLIVSVRYRRILRDGAIAVPRQGVLNLHSGILPDYRGVMATFWAMLNAEPEIGSTLHRIVDSGIDTGPVIGISRTAMRPTESYLANLLRLYSGGVDMLVDAIAALNCGKTLCGDGQQAVGGRYYSAPEDADLQRFSAKSLYLEDGTELSQTC